MSKRKPIFVEVEPEVTKWLFDNSGWSHAELAKRLGTSEDVVIKIVSGEKNPTFRQLRELAFVFKRPVAAFLLSKPNAEKPKPKDYRLLPERTDRFDKKTLLVLRKVRRLQELSKELSGNIGYETKNKLEKVRLSDNPEITALKYREFFGLTEEKQKGFKTSYELFHFIRNFLEDLNIFVFQFSMPVEDARGFVLVDDVPNIIVVNTKDTIEARLFSVMHEFAHILFGESVIDLPDATSKTKNNWKNGVIFSQLHSCSPKTLQNWFLKNTKKVLLTLGRLTIFPENLR